MENTIIIAIVSLLCILAHVPTLILRIVPFHEKISDKDKVTVSASSWEELLKKIDHVIYESRADSVMTKEEKAVGGSFDYSI